MSFCIRKTPTNTLAGGGKRCIRHSLICAPDSLIPPRGTVMYCVTVVDHNSIYRCRRKGGRVVYTTNPDFPFWHSVITNPSTLPERGKSRLRDQSWLPSCRIAVRTPTLMLPYSKEASLRAGGIEGSAQIFCTGSLEVLGWNPAVIHCLATFPGYEIFVPLRSTPLSAV